MVQIVGAMNRLNQRFSAEEGVLSISRAPKEATASRGQHRRIGRIISDLIKPTCLKNHG
jgi:hypothetical protein